jgi:hypothetical protein
MMKKLKRRHHWGIATVAVVILVPTVFGTSPLPPPYHEYVVEGKLSRPNGAGLQNFVVVLTGRSSLQGIDTTIVLDEGPALSTSAAAISITDTSGHFFLDVQARWMMDSLGVQVRSVDKPEYMSSKIDAPAYRQEITGEMGGESTGCRGCESTAPVETYVKGYKYQTLSHEWLLPF